LIINSSSTKQTNRKISHTVTNSHTLIIIQHNSLPFCPIYSIKDSLSSPDYWLTIPTQPDPPGLGGTTMGNSLNQQIFPIKFLSLRQRMIGTVRMNIPYHLIALHDHIGIGTHSSSSDPANIASQP
jgi:hypothetical protein